MAVKLANAVASKAVRRKVKTWYASRYKISETVVEAFRKKHDAIEQKRNTVEILALGSSHGDHGFLPDGNSFNLCGTSQDLYLSYELYRRYADMSKLKTVILFYSVFSPGFETERTSEMDYCLYYRHFWGIPLRYLPGRYFRCKTKLLEKYLRQHPVVDLGEYRGENDYRWFFPSQMSVAERVASHLKNNRRQNGQTGYVGKMAELAQTKGHRLVVVVPPFRRDFTSRLPPFRQLFAELLELSVDHPEMQIMSFVGDGAFVDSDFGDMDHLNRQGAEKLTIKIKYGLRQRGKVLLPGVEWMEFPVHGNHTGSLVALEARDDFPFDVKRVYYIWGTQKDVVRGKHAHKQLEQVIVCVSGSCDFILDNGTKRETVHLDSPTHGLYIKNNIWREFANFSPDCVVMVLASDHYIEADYIRNYKDFLKSVE